MSLECSVCGGDARGNCDCNRCLVCGRPDVDKPQIFKGEPWCCERHRAVIQTGEYEGPRITAMTAEPTVRRGSWPPFLFRPANDRKSSTDTPP